MPSSRTFVDNLTLFPFFIARANYMKENRRELKNVGACVFDIRSANGRSHTERFGVFWLEHPLEPLFAVTVTA